MIMETIRKQEYGKDKKKRFWENKRIRLWKNYENEIRGKLRE